MSVIFIFAVSLLNVRFVVVAVDQTVPTPTNVHNPDPMVRVRVFELLLLNKPVVTFLLFASSVPFDKVSVSPFAIVKSSPNVTVVPNVLICND